MLQALIGPVANLAGTWMQNRAEKAQAKQKLAVAKIEAQTKVEQDGAWSLNRHEPVRTRGKTGCGRFSLLFCYQLVSIPQPSLISRMGFVF